LSLSGALLNALCESSAISALKIFASIARKATNLHKKLQTECIFWGIDLSRPILYCSVSRESRLKGKDALRGGRPALELGLGGRAFFGLRIDQPSGFAGTTL
jgi:hypothetical protein